MIVFVPAIASAVVDYYSSPLQHLFTAHSPLVVQLCWPSTPQSSLRQFDLASSLIPGISFLRINCTSHPDVCAAHASELSYPIRLLWPSITDFTGETIAFDLIAFLESQTGLSRFPNATLPSLDSTTFHPFRKAHASSLIAFLNLRDRQSELVLPQLWQLSFIFSRERGIGVAYVNCTEFLHFCLSAQVAVAPTIRIYFGEKAVDFDGPRDFDRILAFANVNLKTFRRDDGELNDEAGVVSDAFLTVQAFVASKSKSSAMAEIRRFPETDYYLSVMKKLLKGGEKVLETETRKCEGIATKAARPDVRDEAVRHLNVLAEFRRAGRYVPPQAEEL
jgi:hypothetical protein